MNDSSYCLRKLHDLKDLWAHPIQDSHKRKDEEIALWKIINSGVEVRKGDIAVIRTDMHKLWKTPIAHDRPVLSLDATRYLMAEIGIHCIATDAMGLEVRGRDGHPVHVMLLEHNVAMVESLTNIDQLESPRLEMIILPLPVEWLDSRPVRVIAIEKQNQIS